MLYECHELTKLHKFVITRMFSDINEDVQTQSFTIISFAVMKCFDWMRTSDLSVSNQIFTFKGFSCSSIGPCSNYWLLKSKVCKLLNFYVYCILKINVKTVNFPTSFLFHALKYDVKFTLNYTWNTWIEMHMDLTWTSP